MFLRIFNLFYVSILTKNVIGRSGEFFIALDIFPTATNWCLSLYNPIDVMYGENSECVTNVCCSDNSKSLFTLTVGFAVPLN